MNELTPDEVLELPARTVVIRKDVAWQRQALPNSGWIATNARWLSGRMMADFADELTVVWVPDQKSAIDRVVAILDDTDRHDQGHGHWVSTSQIRAALGLPV